MKQLKKVFSIIYVMVLLVGILGVPALAAGSNTVTITSETSGHTYQAFQVFAGNNDSNTNILTNVAWGSGVDSAALLTALKADATYGSNFSSCISAADVATAISKISAAGFADILADIIALHLSSTHKDSGTPSGAGPYTYIIGSLADGYYFINEKAFSGTVDNAYTKYILQVVDDVTVAAKTDSPAVAKKVWEDNDATHKNTWNDAADYDIGDAVPFRIVGLVPDMSNYDTYYYQFTDTLSSGLTFNTGSVKVYYATGASMYAVETSTSAGASGTILATSSYSLATSGNGFTLSFTNLKTTSSVSANGYIVIEYTATLSSSAVIGNPGNPNEVKLTYSNNPNGDGRGETPKDEVVAFTFNLPVNKVNDKSACLPGAQFALFVSKSDADSVAADPTNAKLANALKFSGIAGSYTLSSSGSNTLQSDSSGKYAIKGLDQGTYYLVELAAPTGYNRLTTATTVTIEPTYYNTQYIDGHVPDATDQLNTVKINDGCSLTVQNQSGTTLPETGGIGTAIFTGSGFVLMLGVGVLFTTKKKMSVRKEK